MYQHFLSSILSCSTLSDGGSTDKWLLWALGWWASIFLYLSYSVRIELTAIKRFSTILTHTHSLY